MRKKVHPGVFSAFTLSVIAFYILLNRITGWYRASMVWGLFHPCRHFSNTAMLVAFWAVAIWLFGSDDGHDIAGYWIAFYTHELYPTSSFACVCYTLPNGVSLKNLIDFNTYCSPFPSSFVLLFMPTDSIIIPLSLSPPTHPTTTNQFQNGSPQNNEKGSLYLSTLGP